VFYPQSKLQTCKRHQEREFNFSDRSGFPVYTELEDVYVYLDVNEDIPEHVHWGSVIFAILRFLRVCSPIGS
jgi:hypothetical protein